MISLFHYHSRRPKDADFALGLVFGSSSGNNIFQVDDLQPIPFSISPSQNSKGSPVVKFKTSAMTKIVDLVVSSGTDDHPHEPIGWFVTKNIFDEPDRPLFLQLYSMFYKFLADFTKTVVVLGYDSTLGNKRIDPIAVRVFGSKNGPLVKRIRPPVQLLAPTSFDRFLDSNYTPKDPNTTPLSTEPFPLEPVPIDNVISDIYSNLDAVISKLKQMENGSEEEIDQTFCKILWKTVHSIPNFNPEELAIFNDANTRKLKIFSKIKLY